jgi:hypothetical protein
MSTRTQVYFPDELRARIDEVCAREGVTLAQVVRDAVESYLDAVAPPCGPALDETFGKLPRLDVPSREEWDDE